MRVFVRIRNLHTYTIPIGFVKLCFCRYMRVYMRVFVRFCVVKSEIWNLHTYRVCKMMLLSLYACVCEVRRSKKLHFCNYMRVFVRLCKVKSEIWNLHTIVFVKLYACVCEVRLGKK